MDGRKLIDAAREGNVAMLNKLLQENPSLVNDFTFVYFNESVLHVATKAGQIDFVLELMKHNPKLARDIDGDGFRPLDIAAIMGNEEIVKVLLRVDPELCLLKGRDRRTALHYAATRGRVNIINHLISTCSDSIKGITFHGETALHLAVKSYQVDAFKVLVKWLEVHNLQEIINMTDGNGNTVSHLAASTKQHEIMELLVRSSNICGTVILNAKNANGLTALDVFDIVMENPDDFRTREILQHAGAFKAKDIAGNASGASQSQASNIQHIQADNQSVPLKDWLKYFKFHMQRDSPSDTRNALLVVAALIATVTFQAGVNPPTGVFNASTQPSSNNQPDGQASSPVPAHSPVAVAWLAALSGIFGSFATSYLFLFANSLGLTASLSIIVYLTGGFPFYRELLMSVFAMLFTYGFAIGMILKRNEKYYEVAGHILLTVAFLLPFLLRWVPTWGAKAVKKCREIFCKPCILPIGN